jgi:hypothetical protein
MKRSTMPTSLYLTATLALMLIAATGTSAQPLARQGAVFVENKGQWDRQVKFLMRCEGLDMWITDHGIRYDLFHLTPAEGGAVKITEQLTPGAEPPMLKRTGQVVDISFDGSTLTPTARGIDQSPGANNYFIGNDPSKWASGVRLFTQARVDRLYDGIDALYYLDDGHLRYDLIVAPGADPQQVRMKVEGSNGVSVSTDGSLKISTSMGILQQRGLCAYQVIGGKHRQVECGFRVDNDQQGCFALGSYDRTRALVIDPLIYSTYLGGGGNEPFLGIGMTGGIAVDSSGNAYVTGSTTSTDFPTIHQYQTDMVNYDIVVLKLVYGGSGNVSLAYSTYLGGTDYDLGCGIAVDSSGNAYVCGQTKSTDFPIRHPYQDKQSGTDIFVTKLVYRDSGNVSLSSSTYLGGTGEDYGYDIALDRNTNVYVTGYTSSSDYPILNQFEDHQSGIDVVVTKLAINDNENVSLVYSTYLGGNGGEIGYGLAVDLNGNACVTGNTTSSDFPTLNPIQTYQRGHDVFVTKLLYNGTGKVTLGYSTYLGGSSADAGFGIAVDDHGNAYVTGEAQSPDFPTLNSDQSNLSDLSGGRAFVTKLSSSGELSYSTYFGGNDGAIGWGIAVDQSGTAYVTGGTASTNFPTVNPYQTDLPFDDAFIIKLKYSGIGNVLLAYSTYLGGNMGDAAYGITVDSKGNGYLVGTTGSTDFPTLNPYQVEHRNDDMFVTKLEFGPELHMLVDPGGSIFASGNHAIAPDPAFAEIQFSFRLPEATNVTMEIHATDGYLVSMPVITQICEAGIHHVSIPVDDLPTGSYMLRVAAGAESFVERFIVVH